MKILERLASGPEVAILCKLNRFARDVKTSDVRRKRPRRRLRLDAKPPEKEEQEEPTETEEPLRWKEENVQEATIVNAKLRLYADELHYSSSRLRVALFTQ